MAQREPEEKFLEAVEARRRDKWRYVLAALKPNIEMCLLYAIMQGCPDAVSDVLHYKPFLNIEDSRGHRPIHLAAKYGPAKIVRLLHSAGSTLHGVNREGWSPLHIACQCNIADDMVVEELIACGADVNAARTDNRFTPLHVAIQMGLCFNVAILMRHNADPNIRTSSTHGEKSAFIMALMSESPSVLEALLKNVSRGNEIEYRAYGECYPLHLAVQKGDVKNGRLLLTYMNDMKPMAEVFENEREENQATVASSEDGRKTNQPKMLDWMDGYGRTALQAAILQNKTEMVELLLDAGSDTDVSFRTMLPLELATKCMQPLDSTFFFPVEAVQRHQTMSAKLEWEDAIVRLLMDRSVNLEAVTDNGDLPIHLMLSAGLYDIAWRIIMQMPDQINQANNRGETPLHLACRVRSHDPHSRLELIRKLLEMGLSVNAQMEDGDCSLSIAVRDGDLEVVLLLLSHSPDISLKADSLYTPVHFAAIGQNQAVLEALLDARPEAVRVDEDSVSPLHLAVARKKVDMARCLLQRGANPNHVDPLSRFPPLFQAINDFALARDVCSTVTLIQLLVENGASVGMRSTNPADQSNLTALQALLQALLCCTVHGNGVEKANKQGLAALKILVEAGSTLEPWPLVASGIGRRTPLQSLAYCGLLPCVYYLANVGWPLDTEIHASGSGAGPDSPLNWVSLPGNSTDQDNLHAFLMMRHANPFSLMELARSTVRRIVTETSLGEGEAEEERRNITAQVDRLPVPGVVKTFLKFQDTDYSSADYGWKKLLHLLSPAAAVEAEKAGLTT